MTSPTQHATARATLALVGALTSVLGVAAVAGCESTDSATDLYLDGPPMVRQVRLFDTTTDASGIMHKNRVFGFGTHPEALPTDEPPTDTLFVAAVGNSFRIIISHLLEGNYLENISCNFAVDDAGSTFGFVPVGTTPDDIAKCAVAADELATTCTGDHAVCVCQKAAGCGPVTNGSAEFAKGESVGVLDGNEDGAADLHQFRAGAVGISCGSDLSIHVPIDLDNSYWNPSGDQEPPAVPSSVGSPFDALGPAVVLLPGITTGTTAALPANADCQLVFSPDVTDYVNVNVCTPVGGDVTKPCTPGDMSAFKFKTEPLVVTLIAPTNGGTLNRTDSILLASADNIPLSAASLQNITITPAVPVTITLDTSGANVTITPTTAGGWPASTTFTITIPATVTDAFGQGNTQPITATFTTGA